VVGPYPTALIGESSLNPLSVTLFAGTEAGLAEQQAGLTSRSCAGWVALPGTDTYHLRVTAMTLTAGRRLLCWSRPP
jgi:hypothetical protein